MSKEHHFSSAPLPTSWESNHQIVAQRVIDFARRAGCDGVVARIQDVEIMTAGVHDGLPNERTVRRRTGLNITMLKGQRRATVSGSCGSDSNIAMLISKGCEILSIAADDVYGGLPDSQDYATFFPELELDHPATIDLNAAVEVARRLERAALDAGSGVSRTERAVASYSRTCYTHATSNGFMRSVATTAHSLSCQAVAITGERKEIDSCWTGARSVADLSPPEIVGACAGRRALSRVGARSIPTQTCAVLFEPRAAAGLLVHFADALAARAIYTQASFMEGRIGSLCFPDHVDLLDDPLRVRGMASRAFDDDGIGLYRRRLVEHGCLQAYFLGLYGARRLEMSHRLHPSGPTNLDISSKNTEAADTFGRMLRTLGTGLVVSRMTGGDANLVTGSFSSAIDGFWVEGGEIAFPVAGVTVAGQLGSMFLGLDAIGADVETQQGISTGSWLIDSLRIGGR